MKNEIYDNMLSAYDMATEQHRHNAIFEVNQQVIRGWKNRVKGRDWYDFEWYVRHNVPLDFAHLAERVRQFNNEEIGQGEFMSQLKERLTTANINQVKSDVLPFVRNPKELDIWSNDYFVQLADMMKFE